MLSQEYLDLHFYPNFYTLDETEIKLMNERFFDIALNNVVVHLNKRCYGIGLIDDTAGFSYQVSYITRTDGRLTGDLMVLDLYDPERERVLLVFAKYLAHNYDLDVLDVFNTFQIKLRGLIERSGYFTITSDDLKLFEGYQPTILVKSEKRGAFIRFFHHQDFYRKMFGDLPYGYSVTDEKYVYLMFNHQNKYIKIGQSKDPRLRERTLQSEEPVVSMIAVWKAPGGMEKYLHQQFAHKRVRGEWFKLNFRDVLKLKGLADNYLASGI